VRAGSVAEAVELLRPGFEAYVASVGPLEDEQRLLRSWTDGLPARDRAVLERMPAPVLAAGAGEALSCPDGYLRDAAQMIRAWEFAPEQVRSPTWVLHGLVDAQHSVRNARWLAEHVPGAVLVVKERATHLGALHESWEELLGQLGDS
jgi:pimeloyl-ACP methyl ester carboxylesterase